MHPTRRKRHHVTLVSNDTPAADAPEVEGLLVFPTGLAGIVVNLAATRARARPTGQPQRRGRLPAHFDDLFAFIATAVAGVVVWTTGSARADAIAALAIAALVIAALMLKAGCGLLRDSGRVLLEAAPAIGTRLAGVAERGRATRPAPVADQLRAARDLGAPARPARRRRPPRRPGSPRTPAQWFARLRAEHELGAALTAFVHAASQMTLCAPADDNATSSVRVRVGRLDDGHDQAISACGWPSCSHLPPIGACYAQAASRLPW